MFSTYLPGRRIRAVAGLIAAIAAVAGSGTAVHAADAFPSHRVNMVVPFPAGGGSDVVARYLSEPLAKILGQPVTVENTAGNAGAVGAGKVAREPADGYTIMLGSVNETVLLPIVNEAVRYAYTDFTPIAKVGSTAFMVIGRKGLPATSMDAVIAAARKQPGTLTFGSTGVGSYQQIVMENIQQLTGTEMLHVPYRGGAPMLADLMGGQIDLAVALPSMVLPQVRQQSIKAYAVTGPQREPAASDVPSINESESVKNIDFVFWFGVFGPKDIPEDRRQKLGAAVQQVLADPKVREQLQNAGLTVASPAEQQAFAAFMQSEDQKLRGVASKIKFD